MDLACKICCEPYTTWELHRPRSLPCGHSFCGVCATRLLADGKILCPVCQRRYKYQGIEEISINHDLEDVIERLAFVSVSRESVVANSNSATTGPKLHQGVCEEHGGYKVHYCLTHHIFICSDCALAYHLEADCRRVPIGKVLNDKKADLCKKMKSNMTYLQERCAQVKSFDNILKNSEIAIKTQIEGLQMKIKELKDHMNICETSASKYTHLITECEEWQKQTQFSISNINNITTFLELKNEIQLVDSSDQETQKWTKQVEDTLKQLSDVTEHLASPRKVYLSFSKKSCGTPLGMVVIEVNEEVPMLAKQFVHLCMGQTGNKYSGHSAIGVSEKGKSSERLYCMGYININNEPCNTKIFTDIENTGKVAHKPGLVLPNSDTGFRISTRTGFSKKWPGPAIGEVVYGMDVVKKIIEDDLVFESQSVHSQVTISESGLVIN
ncbi:unnamed protein product [Meganyctiphanes norvegica]|uniref:RING-type domain-containing protein n=1 Tax=Meganyctiphanes norvegica TaxID=48144 RepID=A0AAV2QQU6_MEGNR